MRRNYGVMKDLALHTRVGPSHRKNEMVEFVTAINQHPEVQKAILIIQAISQMER